MARMNLDYRNKKCLRRLNYTQKLQENLFMKNEEIQNLIDELERVKLYFGNYEGQPENEVTKSVNQTIKVLMDLPGAD